MLNCPWGAGKTHYVKSYFNERDKNAESQNPNSKLGNLYASLYGVRSTVEITDQFFAQAHPLMNSKPVRLIGNLFSRSLNGLAGTDVNNAGENKSILAELLLNLDGRVLVFDDLERCGMPLVEVMGFINSFVEHEGLKVIVIANEDEIPDDQQDDYKRKKEKLVGKTLQVASDAQVVLTSFVETLNDKMVIDTVNRESGAIIKTFKASKRHNFRSMRAILLDYERLVTAITPRLREKQDAMGQLLLYMMATGMDFRSGELNQNELAALTPYQIFWAPTAIAEEMKTPTQKKAERLSSTHPGIDWRNPIVPPSALAMLFATGAINAEEINAHLAQHPLVAEDSAVPAWRRMWYWMDLPREQYEGARIELLNQLKNHEITHPGIILHVAGIFIMMDSLKDHILGNSIDIVEYFSEYIQTLNNSGTLEADLSIFGWMKQQSYDGLGYHSLEDERFNRIKAAVEAATNQALDKKMESLAQTFVERIRSDVTAPALLHRDDAEDGIYALNPFLHHIDLDEFASVMITDHNLNKKLIVSLSLRYDQDRSKILEAERSWIKKLRRKLLNLAKESPYPQSLIIKKFTYHYFSNIVKNLDLKIIRRYNLSARPSVKGRNIKA